MRRTLPALLFAALIVCRLAWPTAVREHARAISGGTPEHDTQARQPVSEATERIGVAIGSRPFAAPPLLTPPVAIPSSRRTEKVKLVSAVAESAETAAGERDSSAPSVAMPIEPALGEAGPLATIPVAMTRGPAVNELPRQTDLPAGTMRIRVAESPNTAGPIADDETVGSWRRPSRDEAPEPAPERFGAPTRYGLDHAPEASSATFDPATDPSTLSYFDDSFARGNVYLPPETYAFSQPPAPSAEEQIWLSMPFDREGNIFIDHGVFRSAFQEPLAPLQPLQPVQPPALTPFEPTAPGAGFDTLGTASIAELAAAVTGSPVQGVGQAQAQTIAPTDLGGLLQSANSVQSVNNVRRSPIALDPNIRGYKFGQVYSQATGAYWFPVRQDLDTMLSKIDPGMIQDVVVIPGPYGLRYGPGLSFIDIITQETPRYDCGPQSEWRINGNDRTNGDQFYARATAAGGSDNYGYRFSYGHRKGDDYEAGNGLRIPSAYENRDVWAQFGFNTNGPHQRIEGSYLRLDQTDTQYAAQFFDVDFLGTNGGTLRAIDDDPASPWTKFTLDGWWNRTTFTGSITPSKRRPDFPVIQRVEFALDQEIGGINTLVGDTFGSNVSSGARAEVLYGDTDDMYLRMGADLHYLEQRIRENFTIFNTMFPPDSFFTNLPQARSRDEGLYAEYGVPLNDDWDLSIGGRADWVDTHANPKDVRPNTNLDVDELTMHNALYAYYFTNNIQLSDAWTLRAAGGYAQRPPTMTERYADGVFLGLLQSGFTRVIGDTGLKPERGFQVDAGLAADYDNFRLVGGWFYAWIIDYVTFEGDTVVEFFDAKLVRFTNTPMAHLTGFEVAGEWDWTDWFTPFGKMKYVQGTDVTINAPLPAIPPLDTTAGFRIHDSTRERNWELEMGARMVHAQDRVGEILIIGVPTVVEEATPGFTTGYVRAYYNWSDDLTFIAGIDNMFNRTYQEHLDLRLLGPTGFPAPPTRVLSPGITPYVGIDWTF